MIRECDSDDKDAIDFPEFLACLIRKMSDMDPEEEYAEMFSVMDVNKNGVISFSELKDYLIRIGEKRKDDAETDKDIREMIEQADVEGKGGGINYEQFVKLMMAN